MEKWVDDQMVARLGPGSSPEEEEDDVDDVDVGFGPWQPSSIEMEPGCLTEVFLGKVRVKCHECVEVVLTRSNIQHVRQDHLELP
jgi:hypothetical protein